MANGHVSDCDRGVVKRRSVTTRCANAPRASSHRSLVDHIGEPFHFCVSRGIMPARSGDACLYAANVSGCHHAGIISGHAIGI